METKNIILIALAIIVIGGGTATYEIYDSGELIPCRTGNGWEIQEDYGKVVKALCPYKTIPQVKEWCLPDFISSAAKERYKCRKAILSEVLQEPEPGSISPVSKNIKSPNNLRCVPGDDLRDPGSCEAMG